MHSASTVSQPTPGKRLVPALVISLVTWGALIVTIHLLNTVGGASIPTCFFKEATGEPCAGCGGTRATFALAGGRVGDALALNPMVAVGVPAFAAWLGVCAWKRRWVGRSIFGGRAFWLVMAILFAGNWVYVVLAGRV